MDFDYSPKVQELRGRVDAFMQQHILPNEHRFDEEVEENTRTGKRWTPTRVVEEMKDKAKAAGLWNLFLPESHRGAGLTNLEYAPLSDLMGRVTWGSEVFNCSAPDTGNM
jgi:acyl-CoA dehydrogenase